MSKIKSFWLNNRVMCMLAIIIIVCLALIVIISSKYFFNGTESVYGDRLESIEGYPFTDEYINNLVEGIKSKENVSDVTVDVKGKIVYIRVVFLNASSDLAKQTASEAITEFFPEGYESFYEIEVTLYKAPTESEDGFITQGAKNTGSDSFKWDIHTTTLSKTGE